jgi:hypothetical protein
MVQGERPVMCSICEMVFEDPAYPQSPLINDFVTRCDLRRLRETHTPANMWFLAAFQYSSLSCDARHHIHQLAMPPKCLVSLLACLGERSSMPTFLLGKIRRTHKGNPLPTAKGTCRYLQRRTSSPEGTGVACARICAAGICAEVPAPLALLSSAFR